MSDGGSPMVKYGVAAVLLGVYAAISTWLVAGEGKAYREAIALKKSGPAPEPDEAPIQGPEPPPQPSTLTGPTPVPQPSPPPVIAVASPPSPPAAPADRAPPAPVKKAEGRKLDPFWNEPDQEKVWDFDKLTAADERELGRTLNRMVLRDHAELDTGPLPKRLQDAAKPYTAAVTRKDVKYTFTVLDCPRLNVFSHPGGYIYVCKGLFDWIAEDEDYALGYILAHEIAHVDLAHAVVCMRDPEIRKNFKFGTSLFFYAALLPGATSSSRTRRPTAGRSRAW